MSVNNLHTCSTDVGVLLRNVHVDQVLHRSHTYAACSINLNPNYNDSHSRFTTGSQVELSRFHLFNVGSCLRWCAVVSATARIFFDSAAAGTLAPSARSHMIDITGALCRFGSTTASGHACPP
jgi:hypothetical protein